MLGCRDIASEMSRGAELTCRGRLVGCGLQAAHGVVHGVAEVPRLAVNAAQVNTGVNRLGRGRPDCQSTHRREAVTHGLRLIPAALTNGEQERRFGDLDSWYM